MCALLTVLLCVCVSACAAEPSCHHVALFNRQTRCELYSTHTLNTHCNTSTQVNTHTHTFGYMKVKHETLTRRYLRWKQKQKLNIVCQE